MGLSYSRVAILLTATSLRLGNLVRTWVADHWPTIQADAAAHVQIEHFVSVLEDAGVPRVGGQLLVALQKRVRVD